MEKRKKESKRDTEGGWRGERKGGEERGGKGGGEREGKEKEKEKEEKENEKEKRRRRREKERGESGEEEKLYSKYTHRQYTVPSFSLTFFVRGSTFFSQPAGRSHSVRAKLFTTCTSFEVCWYLANRVWLLRMLWRSSRTARSLKSCLFPSSCV